jgi:branched-chain amino acid aminotransferase
MLNHLGHVAECTADNIFIVKQGVLSTPARHSGLLDGITRRTVLELAERLKITAREETLTRHDLFTADEMFLTGSGAEIVPVTRVDARPIGQGTPGPVTGRLREAYHKLVRS